MNRRRADTVVGLLVGVALLVGGILSLQAYQQQRAVEQMGSMMDTSMGVVHGTNPLWYVLGTLFVAAVIGGGYLTIRDDLTSTDTNDPAPNEIAGPIDRERTDSPASVDAPARTINPETRPRNPVIDLLPEDERRILEPVLESPGITQIELRDRSDFSKSKVSQTVRSLEKRGLLFRERQGRTFRIYPSDDIRASSG